MSTLCVTDGELGCPVVRREPGPTSSTVDSVRLRFVVVGVAVMNENIP